ncbi:general substrate transporter [Thozetella sp. PMI_491]|nr:general substrate transporter [Thozetella sp. PMI_491]
MAADEVMPEQKAAQPNAAEHLEDQPRGDNHAANSKVTFRDIWENKRVLAFCLYLFLLPVNFGYEVTTIGHILAMNQFLEEFGHRVNGSLVILATDQQLINAGSTIGIFVSAFLTGIISDRIGRKKTIILGCFICVAGIVVQWFSTTIPMLFGGKVIGTLGFGLGHSLGPVFIAELAPVKMRGICLALVNTMIVLGQWLNSATIYACQDYVGSLGWRLPIITQVIPPVLLLLGLPFMPESPSWLIIKGRTEEAAASFRKFNGPKFDVDTAVATTAAAVNAEIELARQGSSWIQCFKGPDGRRTLIIVMVYLSQQFIGVNFISGYLTYYFRLAGVQNPLGIAQAAYAIQLFGNLCALPVVDRVGRRPLVVGGSIIMTAMLLIIGGVSTISSPQALSATVAFMCIWGFLYNSTLGAVAYSIGGETPSPTLRQKTYSINIMAATAVSCAVNQVLPYLINTDKANMGGKISFIFFGLSVPTCVYLYFCLPEMKGRNYAELQEMFQAGVPARKFKTYVCEVNTRIEEKRDVLAETHE